MRRRRWDFLQRYGNPFAQLGNDVTGRVVIDWGVYGVPESFLIDRNGIVRWHYAGGLNDDLVRDELRPALKAVAVNIKAASVAVLLLACAASPAAHAVADPREMLPDPKQEARAEALGSQLRCLVCQNESIEDRQRRPGEGSARHRAPAHRGR